MQTAYIYDDVPRCATQFTGKERNSETDLDYLEDPMAEQRIPYDLPQLEKRQLWATSPTVSSRYPTATRAG